MQKDQDSPQEERKLRPQCLSIDLEVGRSSAIIHQLAALRGDNGDRLTFPPGELATALDALDRLADDAAFLLGHNLIAFDLPQLRAAQPNLRLLGKPVIDTLRLNPLAFPKNPYHHLVKHYQDGQLLANRKNDPLLDAELALQVFCDQDLALRQMQHASPDLLLAWHWLTTLDQSVSGLNRFFMMVREGRRPTEENAKAALRRLLAGKTCTQAAARIVDTAPQIAWPLAYALAWLSVAGGNSVMPPWVRHQFPEAGQLVRQLRDIPCSDPDCAWCRHEHDSLKQLQHWFGKTYGFRPEPVDRETRLPLQQVIVESAMRGEHSLGILPTGTGKSLCYQIPALSRFARTGALSVVISPLVALMEDQVKGLRERSIDCCAAINGLLSMPERADVLERVRLGNVGILLIAPEQLRNRSVRKMLAQREIGAWIFDEAHCLSKWGQDFRPDYRYVARFIRESHEASPDKTLPLIQCLTATAKPEVIADVVGHFREKLGIEMRVLDGGSERKNLKFDVMQTTATEKYDRVARLIAEELPPDRSGGAIAYCATRKQTEDLARFLCDKGLAAAAYHARLPPETKKETQKAFISGQLRVIAATNAFGMGIDKSDVRLVVHADIPGSLENYLQEAGRAGRDRAAARCVLLYVGNDVERQHSMSAASRLSRRDIQSVLRALRQLKGKKNRDESLVATSGEILDEDEEGAFKRDIATDDTRVRTAIAWLEEAGLVRREENSVQIFPSALRIKSLAEADARLATHIPDGNDRKKYLNLLQILMSAPADEGITTDELMASSGFDSDALREALHLFDQLGISSNDTGMTAFVHAGVERSSRKRLEEACALEKALIAQLRETAPDVMAGDGYPLSLRLLAQQLKDRGHSEALPQRLRQIIGGLAGDGRDNPDGRGSLALKRSADPDTVHVTLNRSWKVLEKIAERRRAAALRMLEHWLSCLPSGTRGIDLLAETTLGQLTASVAGDAVIASETPDLRKLVERALLWLHEQEVLRLNKGLAIFRTAMTLHLESNWKLQFEKSSYQPLQLHYNELTRQIHIMAEYAERGIQRITDAMQLAVDYFRMPRDEFCQRWLPGREDELIRQTTPESWESIVETLAKPNQRAIVTDERENTNVLVLAGPGSGKTRVLVHRVAYLIRMRRENPRTILALAYNRHAALEIRRRLRELIGDDACGVTVMTCHALAMRLVGASFAERKEQRDDDFDAILEEATALLEGRGLPPEEADVQRDRLLAGFRWILVDEYQDIGPGQYALISALAGRKRSDEDGKLNLFAVGDDDQNIYAFAGASVEFIRRFSDDYQAKTQYLIENYRSSANIIEISNALIVPARERMKHEQPIRINNARSKSPAGGEWQSHDSVAQGRVQILPAGKTAEQQAIAVLTELQRLQPLGLDLSKTAVIARQWKFLDPLRAACENLGLPVSMADEDAPPLWRLRETQALLAFTETQGPLIRAGILQDWLASRNDGGWSESLREAIAAFAEETQDAEVSLPCFRDWLAEWGHASRRRQTGLLLLSAHRAKGLEFDHVFVLDGEWQRQNGEDADAARRLYYVAMTRARQTLTLARMDGNHPLLDSLPDSPALLRRPPTQWLPSPPGLQHRYVLPSLGEIVLSFAGRKSAGDSIHRRLAALHVGDALRLEAGERGFRLLTLEGQEVGRFSSKFSPPRGLRCIAAKVRAVMVWRKRDSDPKFQDRCRCEQWEVVLPELIFAP
ncbi:RecQ family ATP-dependent DNA helicase [Propionivibrio limicola]|uniref:RecQ family ATP-dependent DNA helicase n=1 Tax=Propionivibrio limicola TaxID=167645 RepID=UPI001B8610BF|nr:RecQ family ATP-dependent DNA helicase [Propionivibrio limicola]